MIKKISPISLYISNLCILILAICNFLEPSKTKNIIFIVVTLLSILAGVLLHNDGRTKKIKLYKSSYNEQLNGYLIPYKKFKKKLPLVKIFEYDENKNREEVITSISYNKNNDIIIGSNEPFDGLAYII